MQLPQELQKFPSSTLLIVSDSVSAKFYLLGGDALQELDGIALPRERKQDDEGGLASETRDEPRLHAFIHSLDEHTEQLVRAHNVAHIHLAMPAEIEHSFTGHLEDPIAQKIIKRIHADLMNESPLEIVKRVLAA